MIAVNVCCHDIIAILVLDDLEDGLHHLVIIVHRVEIPHDSRFIHGIIILGQHHMTGWIDVVANLAGHGRDIRVVYEQVLQ